MANSARGFWDRRAREDAFYFVDNRLRYGHAEPERFWTDGQRNLDALLTALQVDLSSSDSVVEVGCGVGRLTRVIAARASFVLAVDVSPQMISIARRENRDLDNVTWLVGDGRSLSGIDGDRADACISYLVFQHIPDPAVTLGYVREMGRVLRSGGWAAFQVSNDDRLHEPPSRLRQIRAGAAAALGRGPRGQAHPAWRGSAVRVSELRTAIAEGGLRLERLVGEGTQFCFVLARRT